MNIKLNSTKVEYLYLGKDDEVEDSTFDFTYSQGYKDEKPSEFIIRFEAKIGIEPGIKFEIIFDAEFECDEKLTDEFKGSHFTSVNAPAIAFPYLRTYVSNTTLNSGYQTVILPAINFQALAKKKQESGSEN